LLVSVSDAAKVNHQIIFATAMIATDLDNATFTVGRFSSHDQRTLDV
jgi:hypothetical protein